jgi:hypothetical protein
MHTPTPPVPSLSRTLLCRLRERQESPSLIHMPAKVLLVISHSCQMLGKWQGGELGRGSRATAACPPPLTQGSHCRHSSGRSARAGLHCGMGRTRTCTWGHRGVRQSPGTARPAYSIHTYMDSTRLKHLPESLKRCGGPGEESTSEASAEAISFLHQAETNTPQSQGPFTEKPRWAEEPLPGSSGLISRVRNHQSPADPTWLGHSQKFPVSKKPSHLLWRGRSSAASLSGATQSTGLCLVQR